MKRRIMMIILLILLAAAVLFFLVWNGTLQLNHPSQEEYPVRGVDVSSYQGEIDWQSLCTQNIAFAFIKATEGSSFVDACFEYNYREAQKTNLRIGAYHFFSFDSTGETQAEHFIATVPIVENMLPPVIDLEFYGDNESNPPDVEAVRVQLNDLLTDLERHYGLKPIIYATEKSYARYLAGAYSEYDIWIRNVTGTATLPDAKQWTFWQFANRAQLDGYSGEEKYIDMNVFNGTIEDFKNYAQS